MAARIFDTTDTKRFIAQFALAWVTIGSLGVQAAQSDYEYRLSLQLQKILVTESQSEAFTEVLDRYLSRRSRVVRRVSASGSIDDFDIRLRREVDKIGRRAVKEMAEVLDPDQLEHFERYIEIAGQQFKRSHGVD